MLRQATEDAYRKGDIVLYKQAKYTLEKEIRVAKRNYSGKLRNKFSSSDSASVWKCLKDITNYKTPSPALWRINNWQLWFSSATRSDLRRLRRVVRSAERIIGTTLPSLQELYLSRVSKMASKITRTPHIQHTPSLNYYRLVDATELWAPERPDTETDSFPKQSIS